MVINHVYTRHTSYDCHVTMSHTVQVASFYYQNLSNLLPPRNSSYQLISPVVSAITNCSSCPITDLEQDVIVQFNNIQVIMKMTVVKE